MLMALEAGKHVLCEKPFTINAREAAQCIDLAREKGLFLMEAVWMRFIPAIVQVGQWIRSGLIGDIRFVRADLHGEQPLNPQSRIFNLELGGGALLDIGIYPISFASMLLGIPYMVQSHAAIGSTGVDEHTGLLFSYPDGQMAMLSCGIRENMVNEALIKGTKGIIRLHPPFHHPEQVTVYLPGKDPEDYTIPYASTGLNYEAAEVHRCIREGLLESPVMPLSETLAVMELMDAIRMEWGLRYPADQ
jgi:predicted dehydrogenase